MGAFLVDGDQSRRIMTEVATALSVAAVVASVVIVVGLNRDNDPLDAGQTSQTESPSVTTSPPTESATPSETTSPTPEETEQAAMVTEIKDMTVDPADYTGACPVTLTFSARVVTNTGPVKATYRWLDVDSAVVEEDTVQFGGPAPQGVTVTHTVSVPDDVTVVRRVEVTVPNSLLSDPVEASVTCTPTASVTKGGDTFTLSPCKHVLLFNGVITVPHDMTVKYRWERTDASLPGPEQTVNFTSGGQQSVEVETTWTLGATGDFGQRLHIVEPFDVASDLAIYNGVDCSGPAS